MIRALLASFAGGIAPALQAPVNGRLSAHVGDSMATTAISFAVGPALLLAGTAARGALPSAERRGAVPRWAWTSGALGAFHVWSALWSVGRLGGGALVAAPVLVQMLAAILVDALGAFGLAARAISPQRLAAVALVVAGVVPSRL